MSSQSYEEANGPVPRGPMIDADGLAQQVAGPSTLALPADVPTAAEHARFLTARSGDPAAAREMLAAHLTWRAATLPLPPTAPAIGVGLPRFATLLDPTLRSRAGQRVLLVIGAAYDSGLAPAQAWSDALAALMDEALARDSDEKLCVLIDCRGGDGLANPKPWSVLPWLRSLAGTLAPNFPERLATMVLVPVPWVAKALWATASQLLDTDTAAKVALVSGPAARTDPIPAEIDAHVGPDVVAAAEAFRHAAIKAACAS